METLLLFSGFWPDNIIAQLILVIIPLLIIYTFWLTFKNVLRYQTELNGIRQVERNLNQWLDAIEDTDYEESEETASIDIDPIVAKVPITSLRENVSKNAVLIQDRLDTIERLEQFHIKLNVEALQNLSIASEDERWQIKVPGMLISISIMLGMLGTFIGLTLMVANIVEVLPEETENISEILKATSNMRGLMSGVSSAFSTTLIGLIGTILATLMNTYLQQKQIEVFATLENFTINKLLPHTIPNIEDENVLENITHNLDASFSNLERTIHDNKAILGELGQVQVGFKAIVDDVRKITLRESSSELTSVINHLITMNNRLREVSQHYEVKYKNVQELERIAGKQVVDYNKMMLDATRLPGWFRWVLISLGVIAVSALTVTGFAIYYFAF